MRGAIIGWALGTVAGLGLVFMTHPGSLVSLLLGYSLSSIGVTVGSVVEARR